MAGRCVSVFLFVCVSVAGRCVSGFLFVCVSVVACWALGLRDLGADPVFASSAVWSLDEERWRCDLCAPAGAGGSYALFVCVCARVCMYVYIHR